MISAPVFWGVVCGAIYFLMMWWIRTQRLDQQHESTRLLYALSEEIVAAHTPTGIEERLQENMPRLLKASRVEMKLGPNTAASNLGPSVLVLPLVSHEQLLGAIKVYRSGASFTEEDRSAGQHIANIVAAALQLQKHQVAPREKTPIAPSVLTSNESLTLMLIDSDPESRRSILKMLSDRGHRAIPAALEEAAEMMQRVKIDAVLRISEEVRETNGRSKEFCLPSIVEEAILDQVLLRVRRQLYTV